MKRLLGLIIATCILLTGCNLSQGIPVPQDIQQVNSGQDKNTSTPPEKDKTPQEKAVTTNAKGPEENENSNEKITKVSNDGSVEELVQVSQNFIDSAFQGDIDGMLSYCQGDLVDKIEKNPKSYIGTKPDYSINKVDSSIKLLGISRYLVSAQVFAENKKDKKKTDFKYYLVVEKTKGDYYITEYKRTLD